MAGKSRYLQAVAALLAAFCLFCATWYAARSSSPEPYQVNTARRPPEVQLDGGETTEEESRPDSLLPGEVIDINKADFYDLQRLPGIGERRAQDIVNWREEHGPFQSLDELVNVPGIGPGILEGLREYAAAG